MNRLPYVSNLTNLDPVHQIRPDLLDISLTYSGNCSLSVSNHNDNTIPTPTPNTTTTTSNSNNYFDDSIDTITLSIEDNSENSANATCTTCPENLGKESPVHSNTADSDKYSSIETIYHSPTKAPVTFFTGRLSSLYQVFTTDVSSSITIISFINVCFFIPDLLTAVAGPIITPLNNDILGNLTKLENSYKKYNIQHETLQALILLEIKDNTYTIDSSATIGLTWLTRMLEYTSRFMKGIVESDEDLSVPAIAAYEATLKPHHTWIIRGMCYIMSKSLPTRSSLFLKLGNDGSERASIEICSELTFIAKLADSLVTNIRHFFNQQRIDY